MKVDDRTAHVVLDPGEVKVGDSVALLGVRCTTVSPSGLRRQPADQKREQVVRAVGRVETVLNERYSVIEFPESLEFREGDKVERYAP